MTDAKLGTFDELLSEANESLQPIMSELRTIVRDVDPDTTEIVRLGDRAASYQVGPQKMKDGYCYIMPHAKWVNLGFYQGASLDDPEGLLEGTGAKMRHVKVRTLDDARKSAVRDLIVAAFEERRTTRS